MAIEVPFVRNPYNYDTDLVSELTGLSCPEPTLAQQHQAEEADINTIVRRFGVSGVLPQSAAVPTYADFSEVVDFQSAQLAIRRAQESFNRLPADVRYRFHNDPGAFVDFCSEESNRDELIKMGLVVGGAASPAPVDPSATGTGSP